MSPVASGFDELIHAPTRLSIMSLLAASAWADFAFVRDSVGLSDSALSKQVSTLQQAGYVTVRKTGAGRLGRTHLALSKQGRQAFEGHVAALQEIVGVAGLQSGDSSAAEPT